MAYYRSFSGTMLGLGISFLIVSAIVPSYNKSFYIIGGLILTLLGVLGVVIKVLRAKSSSSPSEPKIKVKSKYKEQFLSAIPDCATCRIARGVGAKGCPDCGKEF